VHARPYLRLLAAGAIVVVCLFADLQPAPAQVPNIQVQGRIQVQFRAAAGDSTGNFGYVAGVKVATSTFEVRRLRIQANVRFGETVNLVIQPAYEMGTLRMLDAYVRVGMMPNLFVTLGQEKSPFQRYELTSSNTLPSIERGARILGLVGKDALNDLLVANGYASRDLGAALELDAVDHRLNVKVALQNGSRESSRDVNTAKSYYARATYTLLLNTEDQPRLQVGASFASRDRAVCRTTTGTGPFLCPTFYADSAKRTQAFGLDLEYGGFRPGLHVIADFATGDNVPFARRGFNAPFNGGNVLSTADSNVVTFAGVSLIGSYRMLTGGSDTRLIRIIEPALRVDYTDPDTDVPDDDGVLITPVVSFHFTNTTIMRAGVDFYRYTDASGQGRTAREFKISWQANF